MHKKISILLPNLNNREYLEERMHSITQQTCEDWELVVVDSYSQDGAWEFFQECAKNDSRIRIYQSPEKGIYNNLNHCIGLAEGQYIYIATSDDTMEPDALEKMSTALDRHPECDIAHCKLLIIDEKGRPAADKKWDNFYVVRYFGDLINQIHIRRAPHDGILHFCGITVYTSLTQLMIRKRLFDKVGMFLPNIGSIADYEWDMRASLLADVIHIPEYLATWRIHAAQATPQTGSNRAKAAGIFIAMAKHAWKTTAKIDPEKTARFDFKELSYILEKERLFYKIIQTDGLVGGSALYLWKMLFKPKLASELFNLLKKNKQAILSQTEFLNYMKTIQKKYHLDKNLILVDQEENSI